MMKPYSYNLILWLPASSIFFNHARETNDLKEEAQMVIVDSDIHRKRGKKNQEDEN